MYTHSRKRIGLGVWSMLAAVVLGCTLSMPGAGWAQQLGNIELLKQAQAFVDAQNYPAAESIYRQLLASNPDNPEALKRLGILEQTNMKLDESIEHFKRILLKQPEYSQVNFFLGLSYYGKHDFPSAIASLQREAKTPTAHLATQYYLALALEAINRMDEAIEQLNVAATRNPKKAEVFYELARLHISASFHAIDQLRKIDPDSFQYHAFMGEFYSQAGQNEGAISEFQKALKKDPNGQGIHSHLGVAYYLVNQFDSAEKEFHLALQEWPDEPYANLYLGRMAVHDHDYKKALPFLLSAVATHVEEDYVRVLLGRCYIGLGQLEEAKADLIIATKLDPDDPRTHFLLAEIYQKLNQSDDRERELALYNKLLDIQKAKEASDPGAVTAPATENNP